MKQFLEVGKVVTVHGVKGELRVYPLCDSPEFLCSFKTLYLDNCGTKSIKPHSMRVHKNVVVAKINGYDSIEQSRVFIGKILYINRDDAKLKKGSYFIDDLIGLNVINIETNEVIGTVDDVTNGTSQDLYHIRLSNGDVRLVPAVEQFVKNIDLEKQEITIQPIAGLLQDED